MNLKLFSVFHKPFILPQVSYVIPIHAGKVDSLIDLGFEGDNNGDNISNLNPSLSELTAMYYIWKNYDRTQFTHWGLCHYRRYFSKQLHWTGIKKKSFYTLPISMKSMDKIFFANSYSFLYEALEENTVILPIPLSLYKKGYGKISVLKQFELEHDLNSWNLMKEILFEKYPSYSETLTDFEKSNYFMICNMMVAPWEVWDVYLTWFFDIIFELVKRLPPFQDSYQNRMPAFLAERLMNIYFIKNQHIKRTFLPISMLIE